METTNQSALNKNSNFLNIRQIYNRLNLINRSLFEDMESIYLNYKENFRRNQMEIDIDFENKQLPVAEDPILVDNVLAKNAMSKFEQIANILDRIPNLFVSDAAVRAFYNLDPRVEELLMKTLYKNETTLLSRFDFTFDSSDIPKIFEFNSAAPAAFLISNEIRKQQRQSLEASDLSTLFKIKFGPEFDTKNQFSKALLMRAPLSKKPCVLLLNSRFNTMTTELDLIQKEIQENGGIVCVKYIEDLDFSAESIVHNSELVDLVFLKIDIQINDDFEAPFTKEKALVEKFLTATNGRTRIANSLFSYWLIDNKITLHFLRSQLFQKHLSLEEVKLIEEVIPETFMLSKWDQQQSNHILCNKDRYILKKAHDTRGRSVVIGHKMKQHEWESCIFNAYASRHSYIIQDYYSPDKNFNSDGVRNTTYACYLLDGKAKSWIGRTSQSEVTNVGQGGVLQMVYFSDMSKEVLL